MDGSVASPIRMAMPMFELTRRGFRVQGASWNDDVQFDVRQFSVLILQRPVCYNPIELIRKCKDFGIKIIVDLDDDFPSIPENHPGYNVIGKGNPAAMTALEECYKEADVITFSTMALAQRYDGYFGAKPAWVIPNGWSSNQPWDYHHPRGQVLVGYAGSLTHYADVKPIIPALTRVAQDFDNVVIVIGACTDIYEDLRKVKEHQRLFLPGVDYGAYPAMLGWFDILLAPLRNSYFNRAKSDIKLVEAGAKKIPWIASPLPMYIEWDAQETSGFFADDDERSWYEAISRLINDPVLREQKGAAGFALAAQREQGNMDTWVKVLSEL